MSARYSAPSDRELALLITGASGSLLTAGFFHLLALAVFWYFALLDGGRSLRYVAIGAATLLLVWQQLPVQPIGRSQPGRDDIFSANGVFSLIMSILFLATCTPGMTPGSGAG